nr:heavy metal translocating P-type ATPase [uncultured Desulfobacter sp.]
MTACPTSPITIVSELPNRMRLKGRFLRDPELDPDYLEATLEAIPGVESARLNGRASSVIVQYDGRAEIRDAVLGCIQDLPLDVFQGKNDRKSPPSLLGLSVKGALSIACFFLPALFAAPIALVLSAPVIMDGLYCLWHRKLKVEVLDGAAVAFSLWRRDYFTATTIVALLSLGEYFEKVSENKTTGLLKSLLKPQNDKIWIEKDGQEIQIPFEEAGIGDRVVCGPGEMIPVDGRVVVGEAAVNQSSVTGESVPVHVKPGDEVISGSVIEDGRIIFEALHVGAETSVARISKFLEDSLRYESDSQKKSDELADKLVPLTFGLGVGLFALTRDLEKAAAVLTVDYSCVIKLSSPVAVRVAMHTAALQGVLLKGAQAVDSLARVDTLIFDKTGTLTRGELQVTDIFSARDLDEDQLLVLAASAEEHYAHPVASAVVGAARDRALALSPTSQVDFIVAHGVSAYIDDLNVLVGSRHFIEDDEGIDCSGADKAALAFQSEGKSLLYVARDGKLEGVLGLRDELRPEASAVLAGLKAAGIKKIIILTGDTERTANALAASLPEVDEVYAELRPEDKAAIVARLKDEGCILGFTGDGVNDAPALVSADVGICLPSGADLAKESAQVILLKEDLNTLLIARLIALRCQETIKQAFVSAVSLNSSFLLLATLGWLRPVAAAILHNLSTVGIIGYAGIREKQLIDHAQETPEAGEVS